MKKTAKKLVLAKETLRFPGGGPASPPSTTHTVLGHHPEKRTVRPTVRFNVP